MTYSLMYNKCDGVCRKNRRGKDKVHIQWIKWNNSMGEVLYQEILK